MKSLILRDHEVRRLLDVGSVAVVRAVKPPPSTVKIVGLGHLLDFVHIALRRGEARVGSYADGRPVWMLPYVSGEQRWVRETWATRPYQDSIKPRDLPANTRIYHAATSELGFANIDRWRPSVHMPRWASRAVVEVASVRVERVKDLSVDDIEATGLVLDLKRHTTPFGGESGTGRYINRKGQPSFSTVDGCFASAWNEQRGATEYANDPWVWVASVSRVEAT